MITFMLWQQLYQDELRIKIDVFTKDSNIEYRRKYLFKMLRLVVADDRSSQWLKHSASMVP